MESKNLQLSGFKPELTESLFFNLGSFHLKVCIFSLSYKIRGTGSTRRSS